MEGIHKQIVIFVKLDINGNVEGQLFMNQKAKAGIGENDKEVVIFRQG